MCCLWAPYTFSFIPFNACFMCIYQVVCVCVGCVFFFSHLTPWYQNSKSIDREEWKQYNVNDSFLSFFISLRSYNIQLEKCCYSIFIFFFLINMNFVCECLHFIRYIAPLKFHVYMIVLRWLAYWFGCSWYIQKIILYLK